MDVEVTGKKSYKISEIQSQILSALFNAYSPENSDIGGSVRISDIYALIDNLESVDYLHLKKFYTKPWPTTVYGNKELILGQFQLDEANGSMSYFISFPRVLNLQYVQLREAFLMMAKWVRLHRLEIL